MTEIYSFIPIKWYVKAIKKYAILGIIIKMPQKIYLIVLLFLLFTACSSSRVKVLDSSAKKVLSGQKLTKPYYSFELMVLSKKKTNTNQEFRILIDKDTIQTQTTLKSTNTSAYDTLLVNYTLDKIPAEDLKMYLMYKQAKKFKKQQLPRPRIIELKQIPL